MTMSTFQKVTLVSCLVLCVAMLLPKTLLSRGKRDASQSEGSAGQFPPMLNRKPSAERAPGSLFSRPHNPEAIARAKGTTAARGRSNLAGQIIPVYGFGILLYILYIIFKITSKGKPTQCHENRFPAMRSENMKRKITDFELIQLQERLKETEDVMERIVSSAHTQHGNTESAGPVSVDQEEALLHQLREITRVMQEGQLMDGIPLGRDVRDPCGDQDLEGCADEADCSAEVQCDVHSCTPRPQQDSSCHTEGGGSAWQAAFGCSQNDHDDGNLHDLGDEQVDYEDHIIAGAYDEEEVLTERMKTLEDLLSSETKYKHFHRVSELENKDASFSGNGLIRRKTKKETVRVM